MRHQRSVPTCFTLAAIIAVALSLLGCSGLDAEAVRADRATYNQVEPWCRAYIEADSALSPSLRQSRLMVLDTWRLRLDKQEAAIASGGGR